MARCCSFKFKILRFAIPFHFLRPSLVTNLAWTPPQAEISPTEFKCECFCIFSPFCEAKSNLVQQQHSSRWGAWLNTQFTRWRPWSVQNFWTGKNLNSRSRVSQTFFHPLRWRPTQCSKGIVLCCMQKVVLDCYIKIWNKHSDFLQLRFRFAFCLHSLDTCFPVFILALWFTSCIQLRIIIFQYRDEAGQ